MWIAFIFQYLWDTKQPYCIDINYIHSCELLSFFSIFGIQNNIYWKYNLKPTVVNCFHFSVSLGYKTTSFKSFGEGVALWIAFIFQYLWDTKQQEYSIPQSEWSCELLSFFSIFGIQNNKLLHQLLCFLVVNCFHFSVSLGYKTTILQCCIFHLQLWIAFIFQYLWDTKQHAQPAYCIFVSCELLSFFSIFGIQNNKAKWKHYTKHVVNCFHFSVSLGYKTTGIWKDKRYAELWIAFIFQYLWDTKQQKKNLASTIACCELLSFFSIFGIQNN